MQSRLRRGSQNARKVTLGSVAQLCNPLHHNTIPLLRLLAQRLQRQGMSKENSISSFPATQQDIARLKNVATDAVSDLSSTASVHASRVKTQLRELAGHAQEEGGKTWNQARDRMGDVLSTVSEFASERPLVCIGAALALGFFIGLSRRTSR